MPINFECHPERGFFESLWTGTLHQEDILRDYGSYLESGRWQPHWRELANLAQANIVDQGFDLAHWQAEFFEREYRSHGVVDARVAILAPDDLSFGMARMYQQLASDNSREQSRVFRERNQAIDWLIQPTET